MKQILLVIFSLVMLVGGVIGMIGFHRTMMRVYRSKPILKLLCKFAIFAYCLLMLLLVFRWSIPLFRK